ncbi:MAG: ATP-binding cassette domain-containing protein [Spirochaetales bacterium]|uniref:ATP-binding cassette domain-containing protein n=1 Tax=Candidatus Thalassospirochaeta sargassi TaxID=3119039 RepID=A0AAJ1IH04_9SPIO|nr:ATP-binding cassette domain-containing protein [Spirochaetales bacterium]
MSLDFRLELPMRSFDFNIEGKYENGITAVFGPSGAGKTSLLKMLAGLVKPGNGFIQLNGRILTDSEKGIFVPPQKRAIGFVFQEKLLFPHMTVKQNLTFGMRYARKRCPADKMISLSEVVELLDLPEVLDSKPAAISGGEQQRTALGRALLCAPELILLDEPFNAVDCRLRDNILTYLTKLKERVDIPMIVVSHDLPDLQKLTDTVQLIRDGQSEGYGKIEDYLIRPGLFPRIRA